jgi:hypothetical protein
VTETEVNRNEFLGHVVRTYGARTVKKLLEGKPGGRKKGRPRLRWIDVESDLMNMGVKRCRSRSLDRTEWASIMREAKAKLKGL